MKAAAREGVYVNKWWWLWNKKLDTNADLVAIPHKTTIFKNLPILV